MPTHLPTPEWFTTLAPNPRARLLLFCFPYAGGGAGVFRQWPQHLPGSVEVRAARFPGRESRIREPPHTHLSTLLPDVARAICPHLDRPFAFFGHSMGAILSFELARLLRREFNVGPVRLLVSGHRAPHLPRTRPPTSMLPEAALIAELRRLEGTPAELLANRELLRLMLPLLRADFSVVDTYAYTHGEPLDCPVSTFGGLRDPEVRPEQLACWREQTRAEFTLRMLGGGHFFLHENAPLLLSYIRRDLE